VLPKITTSCRLGLLAAGLAVTLISGLADAAPPKAPRAATVKQSNPLPPIVEGDGRIERYELQTLDLPNWVPDAFSVAVPFAGEVHELSFDRISLRSDDFRLLVDHGDGQLVETPAEIERTYRGTDLATPGSMVAASLLPDGLHAIIHRGDDAEIVIQPASSLGLDRPTGTHVVFLASDSSAEGHCGNDFMDDDAFHQGPDLPGDPGGVAGAVLSLVEVGVECDYEFFQKNSNNVATTLNDVENVMNQCDIIYIRDVEIAHELTTVIIRASSSDPYTSNTIDGRLGQFVSVWGSAPENEIQRDVAHMFSGVNFSGGVIGLAYVGVVCFSPNQYGVVESRYTSNLTFRTSLSAHELGHNWNSNHCDSSSPCHIMCSSNGGCNGISGSNLKFGTFAQNAITAFRNSRSCLVDIGVDPLPLPFEDDFESNPDPSMWIHINGAAINTAGIGEPSGIRSLNLDATSANEYGDDEIRSAELALGVSQAYLSYHYQHRGVESGESLFVEYRNSGGDWVTLAEHVSDGVDQTSFTFNEITLPSQARYNGSRVRLRVDVNETNDDWFVDDFRVSTEQGPGIDNDECATAIELVGGDNAFTTVGATDSGIDDALTCSASNGPTVRADAWFQYTAVCTGTLDITTCGAVDFDCRLSVYLADGGCPTSGDTPFVCADDTCGTAANVSTFALAGQTFLIRIGSSDGSTGSGTINIECGGFPGPPNDECADATSLGSGDSITSFSTVGATDSGIDTAIGCSTSGGPNVDADIWYLYEADCTGQLDISICGADFDSRMDVYDASGGCPSSGATPLSCGDDVCGDDPEVSTLAIAGQQFLIRIGSEDGSTGAGNITITCTSFGDPCPEDLNGDGQVNGADLGLMLGAWGTPDGDVNGNGITDGADLGLLLGAWGPC
jgi:hypothetical protein